MIVVQNELSPGRIQNALLDLMRGGIERVRICSAYVSVSGSRLLLDGLRRSTENGRHQAIAKTIVTSFDYGLTEPEALRFWRESENCELLVAGSARLVRGSLIPQAAFHTKFYLFDRPNGTRGSLVGSANLTARGLTINSELAWLEMEHGDPEPVNAAWDETVRMAVPLTDDLLERYGNLRRRAARRIAAEELEPLPEPPIGRPADYQPFGDAGINPAAYNRMWVQSSGMQGGSGTQLELPRGAHRFFGATFEDYEFERVEHIAEPVLVAGQRHWPNRHVTWHGDNAMERINLPSQAMGGFPYSNSLILFRRIAPNTFELQVYPWDSDPARGYVEASRRAGLLFRVGRRTTRLCGFVP